MTHTKPFRGINWNELPDPFDKIVWEKLLSQFWVDTNFPISNDLQSWNTMTDSEKWLVMRVFSGLTLLDTLQGQVGAISLIPDAITDQEESVLANIAFMECIHAKSYSTIFQTLAATKEIDRAFRWSETNEYLQNKATIVNNYYEGNDPLKRKVASTLLESFLFYSGFFLPLWLNTQGKLTASADMIRFIIKDESVHGMYIGYKFQRGYEKLSPSEQEEMMDWTYDLLQELYDNEVRYTEDLYDEHDLTEDVKTFLRYNANKALQNLGFDSLFSKEDTQVDPLILSQLSLDTETHDFFSSTGTYIIPKVEALSDADFENVFGGDDDDDFF